MFPFDLTLILVPAGALAVGWLLPAGMLNRRPAVAASLVTSLAAALVAAAALLLAAHATGILGPVEMVCLTEGGPISCLVYYDGVSGLGVLLVSFVGFVVCRYSRRYLAGDPRQGDYFRWTGATLGTVSIAMLAGNLALLFAAWVATSLSLHRLLLHYPERPGARQAAWTKFAVSRMGDAALLVALGLVYGEFGTLNLHELFSAVRGETLSQGRADAVAAIGLLLACGAIAKSAQFPFHSWLPNTLETPTPVSALMHAGIVNSGGYLMIRMSPLVAQAPAALTTLVLVGAVTVVVAGLSMAAQSSVKRALAYSTVAQMGFMMLQCGLGAFSAAMLHLAAHSLYKAYAFLNSGSVLTEVPSAAVPPAGRAARRLGAGALLLAALATLGGLAAMLGLGEQGLAMHSGAAALTAVLAIALTAGVVEALAARNARLSAGALVAAAALAALYLVAYLSVDALMHDSLPGFVGAPVGLGALVVTLFASLLAFQMCVRFGFVNSWLEPLYVHALNGFYVESSVRRAARRLRSWHAVS